MGAEKGSASKGGMSNKSATTNPVVQGIRADQYAKEKLGITGGTVMNTPAGQVVSGFKSTKSSNQMYGSEYQQARNEYLASQGLGSMQSNGSFTTGVQTDKGLVFTKTANAAYEASKREPVPLSKQMYESQQLFKQGAFVIMGALMGVPSLGITAAQYSSTPYSDYVKNYVTVGRSSVSYTAPKSSSNESTTTIKDTPKTTTDVVSAERGDKEAAARIARMQELTAASARKFYKISGKSITGSMKTQ